MKLSTISLAASLVLASASPVKLETRATVQGFDISDYQPNVNFKGAYDSGARFVIIKVRFYNQSTSVLFSSSFLKPTRYEC
jgi:hypothetical protein